MCFCRGVTLQRECWFGPQMKLCQALQAEMQSIRKENVKERHRNCNLIHWDVNSTCFKNHSQGFQICNCDQEIVANTNFPDLCSLGNNGMFFQGIANCRCYTPFWSGSPKTAVLQQRGLTREGVLHSIQMSSGYRAIGGIARDWIANREIVGH